MIREEMKQIFKELKKRMSLIDISGERDSRRVEGLHSGTQDSRGFSNMLVYLDVGLGDRWEEIVLILSDIDSYLGSYHNDNRIRYLFSFGGSNNDLTRCGQTDIRRLTKNQWQQLTGKVAWEAPSSNPTTIPSLFVGKKYGSRPCPSKHDLLIFFCQDRQILMSEDAARGYASIKKNALWFVMTTENPSWNFGVQ